MNKIYPYQLIKKLTLSGITLTKTPHDRKSLLFINKMSIVNTTFMIAFSITLILLNMGEALRFTIPFTLLFALPPYLNSKGKLFFCRYYFSIVPLIFLVGICVHNGAHLGDKYLLLTTATIPLILFKDKKTIYTLFFMNIIMFFLILWYQSVFKPLVILPEFIEKQYYIYAQLTVFVIIFFVVQYFRKDSEEYEEELEEKNKIISEKNHEIIDSITYAKRLQDAIMPPEREIYDNIPESFILYKPKDIVAGDFYFADHKGDYFFIAAADCTGHGVPGAMVSMVCSNALNRAVEEYGLIKPGEILDKVTELVVDTFKKSRSEVKDGMDISLAVINIKSREIAWAGANNPLWYIPGCISSVQETVSSREVENSENELKEITATKQPVGKSETYKTFTTHFLKLAKGSLLYLFTDGFADQFGGPKGKKFKYKQLAELIFNHKHLNMKEQRDILEKAFSSWKGDLEQIDDVCIIGLRL
jgi:serine phosphatase RsbU (regulator of sigma subunit)